jgi:spermidine dehydrogenase
MSKRRRSNLRPQYPDITRRDFMGSALLGAGAALLSAHAPAIAASSGSKPSYAPLGEEWTGPGGVGDYARSNGNVHSTVNTAHALRDHYLQTDGKDLEAEESFDLIVVGGGISGLMASYEFLKHRPAKGRVLLLDNQPIFGGEAKQNEFEIDGYHLCAPQGSNLFLWPPRSAAELTTFWHPVWQELGMPMEDSADGPQWLTKVSGTDKPLVCSKDHYTPMMIGRLESQQIHFFADSKRKGMSQSAKNPWQQNYRDFPWPEAAKKDLMRLDKFVLVHSQKDLESWLDTMTYKDFLTKVVGVTRPEVFEYLDPMIAASGTGLGCDAISALAAHHFRAPGTLVEHSTATGHNGQRLLEPRSFPGGNTGIARHFVKRLIPDAIAGGDNFRDIMYGKVVMTQRFLLTSCR